MKDSEKEALLKDLMTKSKLEMPFEEFEDDVMMQIKEQESFKESFSLNLTMAWLCFICGTISGFILFSLLPRFQISFLELKNLELVFKLVFSLFLLFNLDLLIRHTRETSLKYLNFKFLNIPFLNKS